MKQMYNNKSYLGGFYFKTITILDITLEAMYHKCNWFHWQNVVHFAHNGTSIKFYFINQTSKHIIWLGSTMYRICRENHQKHYDNQDAKTDFLIHCCGQLWVWHMICGQTCDGLYHFAFYLVNFGIPYGSHTIKPALARHTGVQVPVVPAKVITWHILPTGIHGLCSGYCFSGPLPLRSLLRGPLSRVHFGESLVVRLYSEIDHTYLSIEAQCVSHHYPRWTATMVFQPKAAKAKA